MKALITGGAGFIGSNAASRFLSRGDEVVILDNLSCRGGKRNLEWLRPQGKLTFIELDVRDAAAMTSAIRDHADAGLLLHLAAQVAVTTSLVDPRGDFETNVLGTINLLEAARLAGIAAPIIYSSSNKVYGELNDLNERERGSDAAARVYEHGIGEDRRLDFHSPYGCSKGAADQYVRDYHRMFGLNTVVMRQSCIYGGRQFACEEQGWVAWFVIATKLGRLITIYGDGAQVRDILFVDDLIDAFEAAAANIGAVAGSVFNIGGGVHNAVTLLDVLGFLEQLSGKRIRYRVGETRPGDQRFYVSDIRRACSQLKWRPRVNWKMGLSKLYEWVAQCGDELR